MQQIRTRVLPRRGVWAAADEIVVTVGAQHALYMVADLLMREGTRVGMEDPGYPDARNIFASRTAELRALPVDEQGLPIDDALRGLDYLYATPSHQCPTTVTMPLERREALLDAGGRGRLHRHRGRLREREPLRRRARRPRSRAWTAASA